MKIDPTVGRRIRRARQKAGITQAKLVDTLAWYAEQEYDYLALENFIKSDLTFIENGVRYPSLLEAAMIAEILNVSMDYICFGRLQSTLAKRIGQFENNKVKIIETIIDAFEVHKQITTLVEN